MNTELVAASYFTPLWREAAVVKHAFKTRDVPGREGVIEHYHDADDCVLCALLSLARVPTLGTETKT